jgi:hypothetical protein
MAETVTVHHCTYFFDLDQLRDLKGGSEHMSTEFLNLRYLALREARKND